MWLTYSTDVSLLYNIIPDHIYTSVPFWQMFKNTAVVHIRLIHHISAQTILCMVPTDNPSVKGKSGVVAHLFSQDQFLQSCFFHTLTWCVGLTLTPHGYLFGHSWTLWVMVSNKLWCISIGESCFVHTKWITLQTSSCQFPMLMLFCMDLSPK
jgi:hypothetical protein